MTDRLRTLDDAALGSALVEVGRGIEFPPDPGPALAFAVRRSIEGAAAGAAPSPARRPSRLTAWLPARSFSRSLVLAVALLLALALAAGAATLGIRGIRIIFAPKATPSASATAPSASASGPASPAVPTTPPALGQNLVVGERVTLPQARARADFRVVVPTAAGLGQPAVWFDDSLFVDQVTFVYPPGPGHPEVGTSGVGLLVTEFEAHPDRAFMEKIAFGITDVQAVTVDGEPGFWLSGQPHDIVYIDRFGIPLTDTVRLAGNTLIWQRGDLTLRVEGGTSLTKAEALRIAHSMR